MNITVATSIMSTDVVDPRPLSPVPVDGNVVMERIICSFDGAGL